jgi:glycosyltransferase involved in cell wall biosynthesis
MKLTIIIPCYNERKTIHQIVEAVRSSSYEHKIGRAVEFIFYFSSILFLE